MLSAEVQDSIITDRINEIVHELLGGDIDEHQGGILLEDLVGNGVEKVSLSKAHTTVNEKRVVSPSRRLGNSAGRGMGELVAGTDDEALKGVFHIESRDIGSVASTRLGSGRSGRFRFGGFCLGFENDLDERPVELTKRLGDDAQVVLRQPVAEMGVWYLDSQGVAGFE
jgi:hypothetical protein